MTEAAGITVPDRAAPVAPDTKPVAAELLVVFGITGDLARVMTFRSLYRLEARGLLNCPIVGVAADDWNDEQLRERARESILATGERWTRDFARSPALSYVSGEFTDSATYERVAAGSTAPVRVYSLEIPPPVGRVVAGSPTPA